MEPIFYLDRQNQQHGPVDIAELSKFSINSSTLVWKQGMNEWQPAGSVKELAGFFPPPASEIVPVPKAPTQNANSETLIYSGGANHFLNRESVGGKMYLYPTKLIFKSHGLNIQTHELTIELSQVSNVDYYNSLGFVPNGLIITLKSGAAEKFVVHKRQFWKSEIDRLRNVK